jgi:hypothetical protein
MKEKKESITLKINLSSESQSRVNKIMDGNRRYSTLMIDIIIGRRDNPMIL